VKGNYWNRMVKPKKGNNKRIIPALRKYIHELTYEQVRIIAVMFIIEKKDVRSIAKSLLIKPKTVNDVVNARSHNDYWIDAIADLGRKGMIDG
jgi:hypothetical protein